MIFLLEGVGFGRTEVILIAGVGDGEDCSHALNTDLFFKGTR